MTNNKAPIPAAPELSFDEFRHVYKVNGKFIWSVSHFLTPIRNQVYAGIDKEILDAAARRGTAIHFAIELYNSYGVKEIAQEYLPYFAAYLKWAEKYKPTNMYEEQRTYHPVYWYAGTSDLICIIDGEHWLIDYKTVAQLHSFLVAPQLAAYAKAWISHGLQIDRIASLHLKSDGSYTFKEYPLNESFSVFLECLSLQNYIDENMKG